MDVKLPLVCPVLHYDNSTGCWACERREEYKALKELGWPSGFCNGAYTGCPDYLRCPAFSHWFWEQVCLKAGHNIQSMIKS